MLLSSASVLPRVFQHYLSLFLRSMLLQLLYSRAPYGYLLPLVTPVDLRLLFLLQWQKLESSVQATLVFFGYTRLHFSSYFCPSLAWLLSSLPSLTLISARTWRTSVFSLRSSLIQTLSPRENVLGLLSSILAALGLCVLDLCRILREFDSQFC